MAFLVSLIPSSRAASRTLRTLADATGGFLPGAALQRRGRSSLAQGATDRLGRFSTRELLLARYEVAVAHSDAAPQSAWM